MSRYNFQIGTLLSVFLWLRITDVRWVVSFFSVLKNSIRSMIKQGRCKHSIRSAWHGPKRAPRICSKTQKVTSSISSTSVGTQQTTSLPFEKRRENYRLGAHVLLVPVAPQDTCTCISQVRTSQCFHFVSKNPPKFREIFLHQRLFGCETLPINTLPLLMTNSWW